MLQDTPEEKALTTAQQTGQPVEIESRRSEYSTVTALPDGRFEQLEHVRPVRVRRGPDWIPADSRLRWQGDRVVPQAATAALRFSGGGAQAPLVEMEREGKRLELFWPGTLPKPLIAEDTVEYRGVLGSGVDLQVRAETDGFAHTLIVRSAQAAKDPRLTRLAFKVATAGLTVKKAASGALTAVAADGKEVFQAPPPLMWDSSGNAAQGLLRAEPRPEAAEAPTEGSKISALGTEVKAGSLALVPDQRWLTAAGTRFPVYIDPVWSTTAPHSYTMVSSGYPTESFYRFSGKSSEGLGRCEVAKDPSCTKTHTKRLLYRMDIPALKGRTFDSATFGVYETYAFGCAASTPAPTPVRLYRGSAITSSSTWETTKGSVNWSDDRYITSRSMAHCAKTPVEFNGPELLSHVQSAIGKEYGTITFGLRAEDEESMTSWKRFADTAYLKVVYTNKPTTPATLGASPAGSVSAVATTVTSATPRLTATASSPDGAALTYTFQIENEKTPGKTTTLQAKNVPSGQPAGVTTAALQNPGVYRFRVQADNAGALSAWSGWKRIVVDAAHVPAGLTANVDDPAAPVLSGAVSRPSGNEVTSNFFLYDSAGKPIGPSPLGTGTVASEQRVSLRVPEGLVKPGTTYTWQLQACVEKVCAAKSPLTTLKIPVSEDEPRPATQSITLSADKISVWNTSASATACEGKPCPLAQSSTVTVGGAERTSLVKVDLSALPAGARVDSAVLNLGRPVGGVQPPAGLKLAAHQPLIEVPAGATGAELNEMVFDEVLTQTAADDARIDLSVPAQDWVEQPDHNDGLLLKSAAAGPELTYGADAPLTVTVDYVPAGLPSAPREFTARGGESGALLAWSGPEDVGTANVRSSGQDEEAPVAITGYEVQILDAGGHVLATRQTQDKTMIVNALANGTTYRFQVRARNAQGTGPWAQTGTVTVAQVPGGAARYLTAVEQYVSGREAIMEAKADSGEGGEDGTAAPATASFDALLQSQQNDLVATREFGASKKAAQLSNDIKMTQALAVHLPEQNRVVLHAKLEGHIVYGNEIGTPEESQTTSDYHDMSEYIFQLPDPPVQVSRSQTRVMSTAELPTLTETYQGSATDPKSADLGQINAYTAEEQAKLEAADPMPVPTMEEAPPASGAPQSRATLRVNRGGIAQWAKRNVGVRWDYGTDCANFVSKAMRWGGGVRPIYGSNRKDNRYWFTKRVGRNNTLVNSYSWSAVVNHLDHFNSRRKGLTWRATYPQVTVGDIMYFKRGSNVHSHMAILTRKTGNKPWNLYYTHHGKGPMVDKPVWTTMKQDSSLHIGYAGVWR
ncbi:fibronectin type III domain-containing protein [Spirillospora sp. CA-253888]